MDSKKPKHRLALQSLPPNVPIKKIKEDKNDISTNSTRRVIHPAEKTSLIQKLKERYSTDNYTEKIPYPLQGTYIVHTLGDRYTCDDEALRLEEQLHKDGYQKDYIRFLLVHEEKFVLGKAFIQKSVYNTYSRYIIVNLLLKLQQYFKLPDEEYYMAVKLMDYSSHICSDPKEGVLLAITCLWLVHKYTDNTIIITPKAILKSLIASSNYAFRVEDIIKMERRILVATKFMIKLPDPSIFLEHYMRKLKLMMNKHIYHGSYFVCDCLSKFPKFSYLSPSLVAAIALYTTLVFMKEDTKRFLQMTQNVFTEDILEENWSQAIENICYVYQMKDQNEPFVKYSVLERLNISIHWEKYIMKITNIPMNPIS